MNTTTTKIAGETMQITDEFKDWFEREWSSYQDKAISGGKIVSMAWALKGYRAATLTDEQRNLIKAAAECIAESVTFEQDGFDTPPMPATQWDYNADQLAYALRAMLASKAAVPEGWKLVPVEPTDEMMLQESTCKHHAPFDMSCSARSNRMRIYRAMLAASPTAPAQSCGEDSIYSFERCGIKPTPQPIPQFADAPSFDPLSRMASGPELQERLRAAQSSGEDAAEQADEAVTVRESGVSLLTDDHKGMRVNYSGLFKQATASLARGAREPALAEMLRQLKDHITELGTRWYAGDTAVVDEILQLYCVEKDARATLAARAKDSK
ncbi:hypothetical protein [Paraburkholderia graminis]|uniref:hypothetical protein n=1 Tax=Paraburkholderia graminis TaxID=60548 RepID=UPI0038B91E36